MLSEVVAGLILVCVTTIVQAAFMVPGIRFVHWRVARHGHMRSHIPVAAMVPFSDVLP
jgi:hypothetical protein